MKEVGTPCKSEGLSVEEVRLGFYQAGVTVTAWANANGLNPAVVYALLSGRARGRRGQSHRAAVALGLKTSGSLLLQPGDAGSLSNLSGYATHMHDGVVPIPEGNSP